MLGERSVRNFSLAVLIASAPGWAQPPVNVLTQHNDNNRTGANLRETTLNTTNVRPGRFGKLFSRAVDGQIYAQPLYVAFVPIPKHGTHNVVYVATQHNSVYAFDADDPDESEPLWQTNFGPALVVPNDICCNKYGPYHDVFPELGITSTPVIDLQSRMLYAVSFTNEQGTYHQRLHALSILNGREKMGSPIEIGGSVPGDGDGEVGGRIAFNPLMHHQRAALLLSNGVIYVAFGAHADTDPYHGWVFAYDATTLGQLGIYNTTPNTGEAGIWSCSNGPAADAKGNVYVMTGNSRVALPNLEFPNLVESFVKLRLGRNGLTVVDYFTPCNQCYLDQSDTDLGSTGPILIPDTDLLIGIGKQGRAYVLRQSNLGKFHGPPNCLNTCLDEQIVQRFQATGGGAFTPSGARREFSRNYSSPIFWNGPRGPMIYVWANNDRLRAYRLAGDLFLTTPDSIGSVYNDAGGGGLSLSANGNAPGTGIVWSTIPVGGSSNPTTQMAELHAFDAENLETDLWNSGLDDAFDGLGILAKFNVPTIVRGKVYVASNSGQLHVYGLLAENPPPSVQIIAPTTRSTIVGPASVTLIATALSRGGSAGTTVDFYVDDKLVATANSAPYTSVWSNAAIGSHHLVAIATGPNGATAKSNEVTVHVVAEAPLIAGVISIKFPGGLTNITPMGPAESAGADPLMRPHWNNAIIPEPHYQRVQKEGWFDGLVDDHGRQTGARMSWSANGSNNQPIKDSPGNFRMMRGYLDTSSTTSTNVTVCDLPKSFTANGYDVYVYFDSYNQGETRTASFRIGSTIVSGTDAADTDFSGKFVQAIAGSEGNYVVIPGLTEDRFILEAIPSTSGNGPRRAPINAVQIAAHAPAR